MDDACPIGQGGRRRGGRWTADGGRETVDGGRETVDGRRWTVDGGRETEFPFKTFPSPVFGLRSPIEEVLQDNKKTITLSNGLFISYSYASISNYDR